MLLAATQGFKPSVEIFLAACSRCPSLLNPADDFILEEVELIAPLVIRYALLGSHCVDGGSGFAKQSGDIIQGKQPSAFLLRGFAQRLVHLVRKLPHLFNQEGDSLRQLFKCDLIHKHNVYLSVICSEALRFRSLTTSA